MNVETIRRLNQINRDFYATVAHEFDQTRGEAWPGWKPLLPYLSPPLSVLDVGCGNGRFGLFLAENCSPYDIHYHGIDSSPALLGHARESLSALPGLRFQLEDRDIVENPPSDGDYDLIAVLGVMHHIPGYQERQHFLRGLAVRLKPGGLLFFACWRFYEYPRFRERIMPWPPEITVEPGDYLLDWRRGAVSLRYCHYTNDAEHAALVAATGLREIASYRADGASGDANRYSLLKA